MVSAMKNGHSFPKPFQVAKVPCQSHVIFITTRLQKRRPSPRPRAMPPPPFSSLHNQPSFPALYFYPLNDTFVPKHIALIGGQRVKIGRQTNAKIIPTERNGYFDSKVLWRQHAEAWAPLGRGSPCQACATPEWSRNRVNTSRGL